MPQFAFVAKDRMGNTVQGTLTAADLPLAANQIGQMGYSLVDLQPAAEPPLQAVSTGSPPSADQTRSLPAQALSDRTQALPVQNSAMQPTQQSPAPPLAEDSLSVADALLADAASRRKIEMDLARMGMKPEEIRRLLNAKSNTTEPDAAVPDTKAGRGAAVPALPASNPPAKGKGAVQQKRAAIEADLHSFAAELQNRATAAQTRAIETASQSLPAFRESTAQEIRQAEQLLREASIARRREKFREAEAKCREALALVPKDAIALELLGDLLQGVARIDEALAAYRRALEADPKRASAERKYGDLLTRQQNWNSVDPEAVPKNPLVATMLSTLLPGSGQMYNGEWIKGAIVMVSAALCVLVWFLFGNEKPYETSREKSRQPAVTVAAKPVPPSKWTLNLPMMVSCILYVTLSVGSAAEAGIAARRSKNG